MIDNLNFHDELEKLQKDYYHNYYEYSDLSKKFTTLTTEHFKSINKNEKFGIYIIRKLDSKEVLYIGKSGTIDTNGNYRGQDIPKRLKNVREKDTYANDWFRNLLEEKGALRIEYIFLPKTKSPAFVETALLQIFLNEYNHLPLKNKSL